MPRTRRDAVPEGFIRCADLGEAVQIDQAVRCHRCHNLYCRDCVAEILDGEWYCAVCCGFDIVDGAGKVVWRGRRPA